MRSKIGSVALWALQRWTEGSPSWPALSSRNGSYFLVGLGVAGLLLVPVVAVGIVCSGHC